MTKKIMKLLDASKPLWSAKSVGARRYANLRSGAKYYRGSWQCQYGCNLD